MGRQAGAGARGFGSGFTAQLSRRLGDDELAVEATTKKNANDIPYPGNEVSSAARTGVTLYLSALGNGSFSPLLPD